MKIKAIIVDWGGVIAQDNNDYAAEILGSKYKLNKVVLAKEFTELDENPKYTINQKERDIYYQYFLEKYAIPVIEIKEALENVPINEVFEYLRNIKKKHNISLYLFSNQNYNRARAIEQNHDLSFFDKLLFSCDTNLIKPNIEAFEKMLIEIKKLPEECIFVDDREENINSAKKLHLNTILFKNPDDFITKVTEIEHMLGS